MKEFFLSVDPLQDKQLVYSSGGSANGAAGAEHATETVVQNDGSNKVVSTKTETNAGVSVYAPANVTGTVINQRDAQGRLSSSNLKGYANVGGTIGAVMVLDFDIQIGLSIKYEKKEK